MDINIDKIIESTKTSSRLIDNKFLKNHNINTNQEYKEILEKLKNEKSERIGLLKWIVWRKLNLTHNEKKAELKEDVLNLRPEDIVKEKNKNRYKWNLLHMSTLDVVWGAYWVLLCLWAWASALSWNFDLAAMQWAWAYFALNNVNEVVNWQNFESKAESWKTYAVNKAFWKIENEDLNKNYSKILSQFDGNSGRTKSEEWFSSFFSLPETPPKWTTKEEFLFNKIRYINKYLKWEVLMSKNDIKSWDIDGLFNTTIPEEYKKSLSKSLNILKQNDIQSFSEFYMTNTYLARLYWEMSMTQMVHNIWSND